MAERRMFAKTIVLSDSFLDMPMSARCLYFTLGMFADDDGFVNAPRAIMRQCGASNDDMMLLIEKKFVLIFDSGVIVIKHWRINNYLQSDRIHPTKYTEEKSQLVVDESGGYHRSEKQGCIQSHVYIDKNSIDKDSIGKNSIDKEKKRFSPPSVDEVAAYCKERNNNVDAQAFVDFYESKGWMVGNSKMKDWQAAVRTWEQRTKNDAPKKRKQYTTSAEYSAPTKIDLDLLKQAEEFLPK